MEKGIRIADLFGNEQDYIGKKALVQGWVRTKRDSKAGISFIELNDGSSLKSLQVVAELDSPSYGEALQTITTGTCRAGRKESSRPRRAKGRASNSRPNESNYTAGPTRREYPLQKKRHSFEYLRQIAHLGPRTNTIGAAARVRNRLSFAIHQFFQDRGFHYVHTPIITASDCEGAGEISPCNHARPGAPGPGATRRSVSGRLFRKAGLSHCERSAPSRDLRPGARESLHIRPHFQGGGEFEYQPAPCRVLDG